MTDDSETRQRNRTFYLGALVPLLAFGSTLAGMALHSTGLQFEIQYAAAGSFFASCLLAFLAWTRLHKDIVALSTPIYGFLFLITPVDYAGGVAIQLLYACGLTLLTARLYHRFGAGTPSRSPGSDLGGGPLAAYVESTGEALKGVGPAAGHSAAIAFLRFSQGEYGDVAELSDAAARECGTLPQPLARAFEILRQHAGLLDRGLPRPEGECPAFLPEDSPFLAKPLAASTDPDRAFETQLDNALLLLYSAGWHESQEDRPLLLAAHAFAEKLLAS